jgi:uncharacterized protein
VTDAAAPSRAIELGILSDTHGLLRPGVFEALEGVDHIFHAGDVGTPDILTALEAVAPVTAVFGNTDGFDLRQRTSEVARRTLEGVEVVLTHGHLFGRAPTPEVLRRAYPAADLVIFGHTHRPLLEEVDGCWFVNPGSCGPRRFDLPVGLVRGRIAGGRFTGAWQALVPGS